MNIVSFTELRNNLKRIMDDSVDRHEPVVIKRPHGENIVMLSVSDYESIKETAYLMGNEANASHLMRSIASLEKGKFLEKKLIGE